MITLTPLRRWSWVLASLACAAPLAALADEPWIGRRVFIKETAKPKVGTRALAWNAVTMPATVQKVNGDWLWVGNAWVRTGDVVPSDEAPIYYTRTIRQTPGAAWAYLLRGAAWTLKREYDNAIKDFTEANRLEPGNASVYRARAQAYHARRSFDEALADLTEAIRLAPDMALFYSDRGCVYNELDEYHKAQAQFDEALRIDAKLALAWYNRGTNWHDQQQYDKALADFNEALRLDPALTHAYNARGYVWSKQGRYGKALEDWDESIRIAPYEPWGYHNKARLWATCESIGQLDGPAALAAATKACELSFWDDWLCLSTLAAAYAEVGRFDEAVKWQKKSIALDTHPEEKDRLEAQHRLKLYEQHQPFRDPAISE